MGSPENPGSINDYLRNRTDDDLSGYFKLLDTYREGVAGLAGVSVEALHGMGGHEIGRSIEERQAEVGGEAA